MSDNSLEEEDKQNMEIEEENKKNNNNKKFNLKPIIILNQVSMMKEKHLDF